MVAHTHILYSFIANQMTHYLGLILALLITIVAAKWGSLTRLYTGDIHMHIKDMYVDRTAKLYHMLVFCNETSRPAVQYWKVSSVDGKILSSVVLNPKLYLEPAKAVIVGDDKGHVYIFIVGYVEISLQVPRSIFFAESADSGTTWTNLTALTLQDTEVNVCATAALVVKKTGRILLVYTQYMYTTNEGSIRFLTRAPGSAVFSRERIIQRVDMIPSDTIQVAYGVNGNGKLAFHLFWAHQDGGMYYTQSSDNGASWSTLVLIPGTEPHMFGCSQFVLGQTPSTMLAAFSDLHLYMLYARDGGNRFNITSGRKFDYQRKYCSFPQRALAICDNTAYRLEIVERVDLAYTRYNVSSMETKEMSKPNIEGVKIDTGVRATCQDGTVTAVLSNLMIGGKSVIAIVQDTAPSS